MPQRSHFPTISASAQSVETALGQLPACLTALDQSLKALQRDSDPSGMKYQRQWEEIEQTLARMRTALAPVLGTESARPLDPEQLAILREEGLLESLTSLFEEMVERTFGEMQTALREGNSKALADAAHLLKGSAVNFGAASFAATCEAIEGLANTLQPEQLQPLLDQLQEDHRELMAALYEEISEG